jgi:peptidoglycan/LPS O-acetylase OafA/YrhL
MTPARDPASDVNNFDLLRFCFAAIVVLVHAHILSERPELEFLSKYLSTEFAVQAFFVASGALVFMSYERSSSLRTYFEKRGRRILPAYVAIVLLSAFGGAFVTSLPLQSYFSGDWLRYVAANLAFLNFLHPTLPGLFEGNPLREVNGALWTLKIEVAFYLFVPLLGWAMRRMPAVSLLAALYALSVLYNEALLAMQRATGHEIYAVLARQFPGQLSYFVGGVVLYRYFGAFAKRRHLLLALAAAALAVDATFHVPGLRPAALALIVMYLAYFAPYLGNFGRYGDFSYGLYVVHFPTVQLFVAAGAFALVPAGALFAVLGIVLAVSAVFWHLIERPALKRGSHYIVATR